MTDPSLSADPGANASVPGALAGTLESAPPAHATYAAALPLDAETFLSDAPAAALFGALVIGYVGGGFFATLSASLWRALPTGVGDDEDDDALDVDRTETYAASASVAAFMFRALAAGVTFLWFLRAATAWTGADQADGMAAWVTCSIAVAATAIVVGPLLHLLTQTIPVALAATHGEKLLARTLPAFAAVQAPLAAIVWMLAGLRRVALRIVRTPDADMTTRRLVEGFRAMVEGAEIEGDLGENTRELIANVIEFGAADAAEVMTPRTEIHAVDREATLAEAIEVFANSGFSRIPVYEETVDTIIGTLTALEAAKAVAEGRVDRTAIADVMRPPLLVPETQPVPELLSAFRAERQKMAIVVDEYGGTAGIVTLADVIAEIVGHVQDEFEPEDRAYNRLDADRVEVDASEHVSEVNEELGLDLPEEEDYETLAGYVLATLGRFPQVGATFVEDGVTFTVAEASDRRVIRVVLQRAGGIQILREAKAEEENARSTAAALREGRGTTIALRPDHGKSLRGPAPSSGGGNGDERRRA